MISINIAVNHYACFMHQASPSATGPSTIYIFIAALAFVILALLLTLINKGLRSSGFKALVEMEGKYPGEEAVHSDGANFFGRKSLGYGQIRGNGMLILTRRQLLFKQLAPSRWIEIPLGRITRVENPVAFLGKSFGGKLLAVYFTGETGEEDSIGWAVRDLDSWTELVRSSTGLD